MPVPRIDAAAVVWKQKLLVLGGAGNAQGSNRPLTLVHRWDEA